MTAPAIGAALGAGLLSFLSPCVLPLVPGYLSFISGYSLQDLRSGSARSRTLARTAAFAAGFTTIFVTLGLLFSGAAGLLGGWNRALSLGAGFLVATLGLNTLFDFAKALDLEARFHPKARPERRGRLASALLLGIAFAAGWSPCVGPILASILLLASRERSAVHAAILLAVYSLGLALPFFAVAACFERLSPLMFWLKRHARGVRSVSGVFLVLLGAAMALGRLDAISSFAARSGFAVKEALVRSPGALRASGAALWGIAAVVASIPALRRRQAALAASTKPRLILAAAFALAAIAEAAGLWSTAGLLSEWLLFGGG